MSKHIILLDVDVGHDLVVDRFDFTSKLTVPLELVLVYAEEVVAQHLQLMS